MTTSEQPHHSPVKSEFPRERNRPSHLRLTADLADEFLTLHFNSDLSEGQSPDQQPPQSDRVRG